MMCCVGAWYKWGERDSEGDAWINEEVREI